VCVAPAVALIGLAGWNAIAAWCVRVPRPVRLAAASAILVVSAIVTAFYVDAQKYMRDARAIAEMRAWFREHERPVEKVIWSQAYMCILFDGCDVWEKTPFSADKGANLELVRKSPAGTLIFWDADTGPSWFKLTADDFESAGYERLRSQSYELHGLIGFKRRWFFHDWGARPQQMHLFYKPRTQ
jgi:hypothetical protein